MTKPVIFVPGVDQFERAEFDAAALSDPKLAPFANPRLTFRTNTGQALVFELGTQSAYFDQLVAWANEVSAALKAVGK